MPKELCSVAGRAHPGHARRGAQVRCDAVVEAGPSAGEVGGDQGEPQPARRADRRPDAGPEAERGGRHRRRAHRSTRLSSGSRPMATIRR